MATRTLAALLSPNGPRKSGRGGSWRRACLSGSFPCLLCAIVPDWVAICGHFIIHWCHSAHYYLLSRCGAVARVGGYNVASSAQCPPEHVRRFGEESTPNAGRHLNHKRMSSSPPPATQSIHNWSTSEHLVASQK